MAATAIPSVGPSMAEHLHGVGQGQRLDFQEPLPSPERMQKLFEYHQAGGSLEDFTREVCAARPAGTAEATFPLVLDCGDFFKGVPIRRVMDSLIHDNKAGKLKKLLGDHAFGAITKRRDGGIRLLVRTGTAQKELDGEKVSVLGRTFRLGLESPLTHCYFLDVCGLDTAPEAVAVFKALADQGAKPVYFRPSVYDRRSGLCSTTWRYYFPEDTIPHSLLREDVPLATISAGRRSYRCFGKHEGSPTRGRRPQQTPLQQGSGPQRPPSAPIPAASPSANPPEENQGDKSTVEEETATEAAPASQGPLMPPQSDIAMQDAAEESSPVAPGNPGSVEGSTESLQEDTSQFMQVSGTKRSHTPPRSPSHSPEVITANRFSALEDFDGDAELQLATSMDKEGMVCQLVPRITEKTRERVAQRIKAKRAKHSAYPPESGFDENLDAILSELKETSLTAEATVTTGAISVANRHVDSVKQDLLRAKSAETLLTSLCTKSTAWQIVLKDPTTLSQFEDFISLHALNRQLLRLPGSSDSSFTSRLTAANWSTTSSRAQLIATITAEVGTSESAQASWHQARCTSLFELLLIMYANHTYRHDEWLTLLLTDMPDFLNRKGLRLLSEASLRKLVQSSYGVTVVTECILRMPGLTTLVDLSKLQAMTGLVWSDMALSGVAPESQDAEMIADRR